MIFRKSEMSAMEVDNQPLVDPFLIVYEELHDLIYQHFTGKEAMELSTVSKQWKYNIGVSPAAMKKIALVYDAETPRSKKDVTAFLTSERRYVNAKLENLNILRTTTRNQQLQYDVVEMIAPWVKDLNVEFSTIGDIDLKFPRVEKLELTWSSNKQILDCITPNKLKTLVIILDYEEEEMQQIKDFLTKCSKLQELHVFDSSTDCLWVAGAAFPFKLKTFMFSSNYASKTPNVISNIVKFLLSQSSSLHCLMLCRCAMDLVEAALKSLPLLKELELSNLTASTPRQLTVNSSIEKLTLFSQPRRLVEFLAPLPNLKILKLQWLYNTEINVIASTAMNLREVAFQRSRVNVEEQYAAFQQANPNVNQQIQWTTDRN